jgi:hypothetical protein
MRSAGLGILSFAALGLIAATASAQDQQPQQSSFTALLAKDYEVKAVTLVREDGYGRGHIAEQAVRCRLLYRIRKLGIHEPDLPRYADVV